MGVVASLWIATRLIVRDIESEFPPVGEFVTVDGAKVHYVLNDRELTGEVPTMVFVHGASGNLRDARTVYEPPLRGSVPTLFFDRPGHGYSDPFNGSNDPKDQAKVIAGLLDALSIKKAIIVGHSYGGAVTAAFGVLYPERTAGIVFLAPATHPWYTGVDWHYTAGSMPVLGWLFSHLIATPGGSLVYPKAVKNVFSPDPMPDDYKETSGTRLVLRPSSFHENAKDVASLHMHVEAFHERYKEITVPTVIYHGNQDDIVSPEIHSLNGLAKDIQGAELRILEGTGHKPDYIALDHVVEDVKRMAGVTSNP